MLHIQFAVNGVHIKLTQIIDSAKPSRVGRHLEFPERIHLKLPRGTKQRIAGVLGRGEKQMDFVRGPVLRELARREKAKPKRRQR